MKKLVLVWFTVCGLAAVLSAAPIARLDFPCENFWGTLSCPDELPEGIRIGEKKQFLAKHRKGYTFPVYIDLGKVTEFELTFKFSGTGKARMAPALTGYADDDCKTMTELECMLFEVDGDKSAKTISTNPAVFKNWLSMTPFIDAAGRQYKQGQAYWQIWVTNGKTIKVKAIFRVPQK